MRKLSHLLFVFGSLTLLAACGGSDDSLGVKGNNQNGGKCQDPDPSTLGCGPTQACPSGMVCDPNACHPSACSCDPTTGDWQCSADCGLGSCVSENQAPKCTGPDPSLGCDNGCPSGSKCDPTVCRPSACGCDPTTGDWICTADCGQGGACVPDTGAPECSGPDPSKGCDGGCPSGTICDPNACRPSGCGCDPTNGNWICTADCGQGGACVPETQKICDGPDPSQGCDGGCPSGSVCDPTACRPSACSCDPTLGSWLCTADCGSGGTCVTQK